MGRYVALLRGINVGGKNIIPMAALKECFEEEGFGAVTTYIQSGNVLFDGSGGAAALTTRIERTLGSRFGYRATVVLRSERQMRAIVERAPVGFGSSPQRYRYDVIFLMPPLSAPATVKLVPTKDGVDQVRAGSGVLYSARLADKASQSRLSRLASLPIYQRMTIRNWNTTTKLLTLLEGR